jgi:hypothetical protein
MESCADATLGTERAEAHAIRTGTAAPLRRFDRHRGVSIVPRAGKRARIWRLASTCAPSSSLRAQRNIS